MDNLDWKSLTEDDIVRHYKPIITKVINSCFSNYHEYLKVHMFSYEELEHFGMIGIMEAARTFDESKNCKFKTHVVNRIKFAILNYSKEASLRSKNKYTSEVLNVSSLNEIIPSSDGVDGEIIDLYVSEKCEFDQADNDMYMKNAISKLNNDKTIPKEYVTFFLLRLNGFSMSKIARHFNTTFYYVETILDKYKQQASELLNLEESFNEFK